MTSTDMRLNADTASSAMLPCCGVHSARRTLYAAALMLPGGVEHWWHVVSQYGVNGASHLCHTGMAEAALYNTFCYYNTAAWSIQAPLSSLSPSYVGSHEEQNGLDSTV